MFARFLIFLLLIPSYLIGQHPCGSLEPVNPTYFSSKEIQKEIERLKSPVKQDPRIFMMNVNIIRNNSGNLGLPLTKLNAAMVELNEAYQFANIRFEICDDIKYIDDSALITTDNFEVGPLMDEYNIDNVINVYFIPEVKNASGDNICGSASFPSTIKSERRVLMDNDCVDNGSTFIHELGHFFNLLHTHSTAGGKERVARINCESLGDGFCDTPADPRLGSDNTSSCVYDGNEQDDFGETYSPDPSNYMSYAPKVCRIAFTEEQQAAISLTAINQNDYLRASCGISDYEITSNTFELSFDLFEDLEMNYSVENSKLIDNEEISVIGFMSDSNTGNDVEVLNEKLTFDEDNQKLDFEVNLPFQTELLQYKYINIWIDKENEIEEYNEYNNKISVELRASVSANNQVKLFPNPVQNTSNLFLVNREKGSVVIEFFDNAGSLKRSVTIDKQSNYVFQEFDLSDLSSGIYIARIWLNEERLETIKFLKL